MKAKRVLLHLCILVLAVICMGAGMYVYYWDNIRYQEDHEYYYNFDYAKDVEDILYYGYVENELRSEYGDLDKVLIEDEVRGNVTVEDIWEIFQDRYAVFYESGAYMEYANFEDYSESLDYLEGYSGTLYEEDKSLMKTYKNMWKENPTTPERKEDYLYYKAKCEYVDEFAELVNSLLMGMKYDGVLIEILDINNLLKDAYPPANFGFIYYLEYTSAGKRYTISNVEKEDFEKEGVVDLTVKEKGKLVQKNPLYGVKDVDELPDRAINFLKSIEKLYMAVDTSFDSNYSYYMENIENQLTDQEMDIIEDNAIKCIITVITTLLIAFILYVLLMIMAGHREKGDKASLYKNDKLWLDVIVALIVGLIVCEVWIVIELYDMGYDRAAIIGAIGLTIPTIESIIIISESFMRRLKTRSLIETTLLGKLIKWIMKLIKKAKAIIIKLWSNIHLTWKVIILGIVFLAFELFNSYLSYEYGIEGIIIQVIVATVLVCGIVWLYFDENRRIKEGAKEIAEGNIDYKIEEKMKFSVNEELKDSINSIGDGLNGAVLESIKNERMKTELIANVSHDLKTPLTSIINYIDLLKNEGLDSENAVKYLDVLDKKSQRLKNLTEDLVEVSKLNSGAVSLQLEKIDIVQLVKQSLGEYAEKFQERKLQVVKNIQQEPIYVMADGSKTWRLFENLYQNVYKYAMPGTRVYIDIKQEYGKAVVSVKNISEGPLNFSADELMERFVRGDVSRTTEGSGLGLSIARSIAERQKGSMNIVLDGDLFKVEVMINLINQ